MRARSFECPHLIFQLTIKCRNAWFIFAFKLLINVKILLSLTRYECMLGDTLQWQTKFIEAKPFLVSCQFLRSIQVRTVETFVSTSDVLGT